MEPITPKIIDLPGYAVLQFDLNCAVGNTFTAYCAGNRRSAFRADMEPAAMLSMLTNVMEAPLDWVGLDTMSKMIDYRERIKGIHEYIATFLGALQTPYEMVNDLGMTNLAEFGAIEGFELNYVSAPGFGYPRPLLSLLARSDLDSTKGYHLVSPSSAFSLSIAQALMTTDLGRYTTDLVPAAGPVGVHDNKSQPFGTAFAFTEQMEELAATLLLYCVQGTLLSAHVQRRWEETSHQLAWVTEEASRTALEARARMRDVIYALPMHPLMMYIASAFQTGRIKTYQGEHDLLYRPTPRPVSKEPISEMRDALICAAVADLIACKAVDWDGTDESKLPKSYGEMYRLIRTWNRLTDRWPGIARKLGWQTVRGDMGTVVASGADFILTDGLGYSDPPTAGLLGIRPVIAVSNVKVTGFVRRFDADWNIGDDRITYNTMVIDGFQGDTCNDAVLERLFIPTGMWMGEDDVVVLYHSAVVRDPLGTKTIEYYIKQSPGGYVRLYYTDAEVKAKVSDGTSFKQTTWDGWSEGKHKAKVQALMLECYGPDNVEVNEKVQFYHRERFYHRFPTKMCRGNHFEWWNAYGHFKEEQEFDGNVAFNEKIDINLGTGDLEAIVQSAPVQNTLGAKLPAGTTEQVKLSE